MKKNKSIGKPVLLESDITKKTKDVYEQLESYRIANGISLEQWNSVKDFIDSFLNEEE